MLNVLKREEKVEKEFGMKELFGKKEKKELGIKEKALIMKSLIEIMTDLMDDMIMNSESYERLAWRCMEIIEEEKPDLMEKIYETAYKYKK